MLKSNIKEVAGEVSDEAVEPITNAGLVGARRIASEQCASAANVSIPNGGPTVILAPAAAVEQPVGVVTDARFLLDRMDEWERDLGETTEIETDYIGHVHPAKERLRAALSSVSIPLEEVRKERDEALLKEKRTREEFWEVEKERQAVCLALKHHSNSSTPVSYIARQKMTALEAAEARASSLEALAEHINWELDWGERDPNWEGSECGWRVHERSGNVNDREWKLLGFGATPEEALRRARDTARGA